MAEGGSKRINVVVKTPKDKKTVEVDEDSGIREVSAVRVTHSGGVVTLGDPKPLRCPCPFPFPSIPLRPRPPSWTINACNRGYSALCLSHTPP